MFNLNGIALDEFNIGGRGALVNLLSGRALNIRFDGAGQNARLNMAEGTSAENVAIAAPNVTITGPGYIRSLLVINSGANIAPEPEFTTIGVNLSAIVDGKLVSGPRSTTPNLVDRVYNDYLHVQLLANWASSVTLDQETLKCSTVEGRSATEIRVTQDVTGQIPLTERNGRYAYWLGFFVPAPFASNNIVSLTYEFADGDPVTFSRGLDHYNGKQGLFVYLPVFRKPETATGQLKETLYINWGDGATENLQFMSSTLSLTPLNAWETDILQDEFNLGVFHSIDEERPLYRGAEAVRRILSSDNPLGLPSSGNGGLDALNRAVTTADVKSVLEERQFSQDLTVDTSGNSAYSRLSGDGKDSVAEAVLNGRKSPYVSPAAVKAIFDKAVNDRLAKESSLLSAINGAGDAAALRKIIENAANAAILRFQTGADPYKSYPNAQKDEMAAYLFSLRPYPTLQAVIDAIRDYLNNNPVKPADPNDAAIKSIAASPNSSPKPFATGNKFSARIVVTTTDGALSSDDVANLTLNWAWKTNAANPIASVARDGDTLIITALRVGTDTLTVTAPAGNKSFNISVVVTAPILASSVSFSPNNIKMIVGETQNLQNTNLKLTPSGATDSIKWSSNSPDIATVDQLGNVVAIDSGVCRITAETENHLSAECLVMVFRNANDVVVDPDSVILTPGSSQKVTAYTYVTGRPLFWQSADIDVAKVDSTGNISIPWGVVPPQETTVTVSVAGSDLTATIDVTVKANTGISISLENAIMYSGEVQQLRLEVADTTLQNQKYYVQVTGGIGGVAARLVNSQPVGINDIIQIQALSTGVGPATIRLFNNANYSGDSIGDPVTVIVSPKSVDGVSFDHSGTSILPAYVKGTISESQYGYILEMKLSDKPIITPMQSQSGSLTDRVPLTQPMTWFSYVADCNRETLLEIRTLCDGSGGYSILDKNGDILGAGIDFEYALHPDETDPIMVAGGVHPPNGTVVSRSGFFKYDTSVAFQNTKMSILRDADYQKVPSPLLRASNGNLVADTTQPTGLAAVAMTPSRGNLTAAQWNEWGNLFYETVNLYAGGRVNPLIARQSQFALQKRDGAEWILA
ncbi:MAG: Ig-like domain-containing protein, partial [Clostridia bacterium]|nr:Ig-like domain-containing protein [Clostridia bacterium]